MAIYVQRRILSIRVGTQKTLIAEMDYKTKNPHVHRFLSFDTPEGVIEDGFILKSDVLAEAIKEKLKEEKIAVKEVIFTVTSSKIANREVSLPVVSEVKIKKLIGAQAADYFPFDLSEYVLTHMVQNVDKKKKTQDLLLFASPNDLIQSYYDLAKKMNSTVMFIDYDGNSSFQILRKQVRENSTAMAIQMNTNNCMINIMHGDKLMLQRSIPYGIAPVFETVVESDIFNTKSSQAALTLLEDQHVLHTHLNNDAVKNLKVNESMLAISDSYRRNLEYESARVDVTDAFTPMINNFIRIIDYYHSKHSEHSIKEVILTGMGANIAGILDLFSNETGIEVKQLDDIVGVSMSSSIKKDGYDPIEFISCIGATFKPIGFASLDVVKKEKSKNNAMNYTVLTVLAVIVSLGFIAFSYFQYSEVKSKNKQIEDKINLLKSVEDVFATNQEANDRFEAVDNVYRNSYSSNDQMNELMDDITARIPSNMVVNNINIKADLITMDIVTDTNIPPITRMIQEFESIDRITDFQIKPISIQSGKTEGMESYGFSVEFRYKSLVELEEEEAARTLEAATQEETIQEEEQPAAGEQ